MSKIAVFSGEVEFFGTGVLVQYLIFSHRVTTDQGNQGKF